MPNLSYAARRATAERRVPVDQFVNVECPSCEGPMVAYCCYGRFDSVEEPCASNCHREYCEAEWAALQRDAEDGCEGVEMEEES